jgi:hypothetical protein
MDYSYSLVIGDYSNDGHNQSDTFSFRCSHNDDAIYKAYASACKRSGVKLEDILEEYDDSSISEDIMKDLVDIGVRLDVLDVELYEGEYIFYPESVALLFLEMVRSQLEGFAYEMVKASPCLNGWNPKLSLQFGYGVYS